jgi:Tfp pilus assembly protein PilF
MKTLGLSCYFSWRIFGSLLILMSLSGCTADRYQQQANTIKDHVKTFYDHLGTHQVDQAVSENQQIEVIALSAEERLLRRVGQMNQGEKMQEWKIIKTAKETAAENWLALARYFSETQQFDKARETYRRIMNTYKSSPYDSYVTRAKTGLQDLNAVLDPNP